MNLNTIVCKKATFLWPGVSSASKSISKRVFGATGPTMWNKLPLTLYDALLLFKHKTYLKEYMVAISQIYIHDILVMF